MTEQSPITLEYLASLETEQMLNHSLEVPLIPAFADSTIDVMSATHVIIQVQDAIYGDVAYYGSVKLVLGGKKTLAWKVEESTCCEVTTDEPASDAIKEAIAIGCLKAFKVFDNSNPGLIKAIGSIAHAQQEQLRINALAEEIKALLAQTDAKVTTLKALKHEAKLTLQELSELLQGQPSVR
jgi:hypothetical protein